VLNRPSEPADAGEYDTDGGEKNGALHRSEELSGKLRDCH
jgi:hypothetical protein